MSSVWLCYTYSLCVTYGTVDGSLCPLYGCVTPTVCV